VKLFITILQEEDYRVLAERLTEKGIYHTRIAGEGGFLGWKKGCTSERCRRRCRGYDAGHNKGILQ